MAKARSNTPRARYRRERYRRMQTEDPVGYALLLLRQRAENARQAAKRRARDEVQINEALVKVAKAGLYDEAQALKRQKDCQ